ncbi:hypothetical protein RHGRI_024180 [Rhododendron griersonianum]|uniref:DUF4005 domain-containing protein n=1 Tax=Rhododendron griersonianum TaxID=479676 RepID=A0AAV6J6I8_9ERIC|nr:hypothetical protein RHGRI_024180 [Rhododendron griersonianum]
MGKSPGKWIKTVLFGKKSSKSNVPKGREKLGNEKEVWVAAKAPEAAFVLDPPLASDFVPNTIATNGRKLEESNLISYARRAFRALKGIIRLQALVRGHFVRRQAVSTLHCMVGLVKLQALARGRYVRCSDAGLQVQKKSVLVKPMERKLVDPSEVNTSFKNQSCQQIILFIRDDGHKKTLEELEQNPHERLFTSSPAALSLLREPISQTKKVLASKSQTKQINPQTIDTESGRVKPSIGRNPPSNFEDTSTQPVSEFEKSKRNGRKVPSYPADSIQENPQNELKKVKRNLRKKQTEGEESVTDSSEKIKNRGIATVSELPDIETTLEPLVVNEETELLRDDETAVETQLLDSSGKDESMAVSNGELSSREDLTVDEIKESAQKAAPLAKQEHSENGIQNRPTLPSYMAATESAKAKLRAQGSPRLGQDVVEKCSLPRRHSLPASTNSKVGSASPRSYRDQHK